MIEPSREEHQQRDRILDGLREAIRQNVRIDLVPNGPFSGFLGPYSFIFEGEEDLLHLSVERKDGAPISPEEGQEVAQFLLPELAPGVIWLKPGTYSQHFYFGHDELL